MVNGLPAFRKIQPEDFALIKRMTAPYPPYSDVQPTGMLAWDPDERGELAIVNGNLAFKMPQYDGDGYFVTFIGTHDVVKTVRQLLRFARGQPDVQPELRRIPEVAIRHAEGVRSRFTVTEAPDDHDYIFGIADLATLAGPDYTEKRRAIRRLQAETAAELRPIDVREPYAQALMLDIFDRWVAAKGVEHLPETSIERRSIQRMFALTRFTGDAIVGLALFDGVGEPLGFCTAEVLQHGYAIGHFEKTDPARPGVSALMRQRIAHYLQVRGCRYLNGEPDLGVAGMRTSKGSWAPRFYLRKYTIAEV